jgi:hypothetical protein
MIFILPTKWSNFAAWYAEVLVARISCEIEIFLAGTGIEPLPFGSNKRYALLTGAITTRLYRRLGLKKKLYLAIDDEQC